MNGKLAIFAGLLALGGGAAAAHHAPAVHRIGIAEGTCRAGETGPAVLVDIAGMRDRRGLLRLEVYPLNDADFLADDSALAAAGKVFRRVEVPVPAQGPVVLCIRVPAPGEYAMVLIHDRESNHKFSWWEDGVGFPGNPHLGWSKPKAIKARLVAGAGIVRTTIVLNYRHGLGMAPLKQRD